MTDQPTAPQTWDTLPDDPDAIPFPIVVGWKAHDVVTMDNLADLEDWLGDARCTPDWWMPWPALAPDPMTVNQWHDDMALLPDGHPEWVWIEHEDGRIERRRLTYRKFDVKLGHKRWRSEAAMLAHVGGTVEGE